MSKKFLAAFIAMALATGMGVTAFAEVTTPTGDSTLGISNGDNDNDNDNGDNNKPEEPKDHTVSIRNPARAEIIVTVRNMDGSVSTRVLKSGDTVPTGTILDVRVVTQAGYYCEAIVINGGISYKNFGSFELNDKDGNFTIEAIIYSNSYRNTTSNNSNSGKNYGTSSKASTGSNPVSKRSAISTVRDAVQSAINRGDNSARAEVVLTNPKLVSMSMLDSVADAAATYSRGVNVTPVVCADTVVGGKIRARFYIDPADASHFAYGVKTGISTSDKSVAAVENRFKDFGYDVSAIRFDHEGNFGTTISAAVDVDLSGFDTSSLHLYSYDMATNSYEELDNAGYYVDTNGFLHFDTSVGGYIVVSDGNID